MALSDDVRFGLIIVYWVAGQLNDLWDRAVKTLIGPTGYGPVKDDLFPERSAAKPLSPEETWLLLPWIEEEKKVRKGAFRLACIEVTGEDPETDW